MHTLARAAVLMTVALATACQTTGNEGTVNVRSDVSVAASTPVATYDPVADCHLREPTAKVTEDGTGFIIEMTMQGGIGCPEAGAWVWMAIYDGDIDPVALFQRDANNSSRYSATAEQPTLADPTGIVTIRVLITEPWAAGNVDPDAYYQPGNLPSGVKELGEDFRVVDPSQKGPQPGA